MEATDRLLRALDLVDAGDGTLRGGRAHDGPGMVYGGELLAQAIAAAGRAMPGKRVKSVQAIFARAADQSLPVVIHVEPMQEGRNLGSATVTFDQEGKLCTRVLVLLDAADPDFVHHQAERPAVADPDEAAARDVGGHEMVFVDDVDLFDPGLVGPATMRAWTRFPGAPTDDPNVARALLAFTTDHWLIGAAMRPHPGLGLSVAHRTVSTGVLSLALVFHDDFDAGEWLLLDHESEFAGGGRCYGRANVFTRAGDLVATFTQEGLLRAVTQDGSTAGAGRL